MQFQDKDIQELKFRVIKLLARKLGPTKVLLYRYESLSRVSSGQQIILRLHCGNVTAVKLHKYRLTHVSHAHTHISVRTGSLASASGVFYLTRNVSIRAGILYIYSRINICEHPIYHVYVRELLSLSSRKSRWLVPSCWVFKGAVIGRKREIDSRGRGICVMCQRRRVTDGTAHTSYFFIDFALIAFPSVFQFWHLAVFSNKIRRGKIAYFHTNYENIHLSKWKYNYRTNNRNKDVIISNQEETIQFSSAGCNCKIFLKCKLLGTLIQITDILNRKNYVIEMKTPLSLRTN